MVFFGSQLINEPDGQERHYMAAAKGSALFFICFLLTDWNVNGGFVRSPLD